MARETRPKDYPKLKNYQPSKFMLPTSHYDLHISRIMNMGKVDIDETKVDIENGKVDIENVLSQKGSGFSAKTTVHIHRLFDKFGFD